MANLLRRSLSKVTYAPIKPSPEDERSGAILKRQRGLDKVVYANALQARADEIEAVKASLHGEDKRKIIAALDAINEATGRRGLGSGWKRLARIEADTLAAGGRAIAVYRRKQRTDLRKQADALAADHAAYLRAKLEKGAKPPALSMTTKRIRQKSSDAAAWQPPPAADPRLNAASLKPSFNAALDWARVHDPVRADALVTLARKVVGRAVDLSMFATKVDWDRFTHAVVTTLGDNGDWTDDLTDGFMERMKVEPIGRLHLERVDMTPVGVQRGELLHSVGLAPSETVMLIHREWSSREVTFEKVVTEEFEQTAEEDVTENTELSSAVETTSRHSSALNTEATASGSYGFVSGSASVGYNSTSDDEAAKRDSRNHAISVTRKASSRTRKEHKTTFTVKQQAGVEDQSVRTITNSSDTHPMRVDFHQMIRDWRVDLYRYGLRLTYDIVVPAPGVDLLANVDELRRIDYELAQPFSFSLLPSDITRDKWPSLAALYGADVTPPDPETMQLFQEFAYPPLSEDDAKPYRFDTLEFDLPAGYVVHDGAFQAYVTLYEGGHFDVPGFATGPIGHTGPTPRSYPAGVVPLIGRTGHLIILMACNSLQSGHAEATLEVVQGPEAWLTWQNNAWAAMRKGAEELWQAKRQDFQQRRDRLAEDLSKWDPLTLRRMEREEVMKTTLKWIFGPAFDLMPSEVISLYGDSAGDIATLEPSGLTPEQWAQVLGFGEFIKYLQQAIEWENVLFFVYPYFWDNPRNRTLKLFLQHPDSMHQEFLRGGAARVVLTVRPGFEDSFTKLFVGADKDADIGSHPYLTIAQEIQNYANTNYPGVPGAHNGQLPDPEDVEAAELGKLIAEWHEYTPISATDITVNTPLSELK
jgi:hypothetical protein